MHKVYPGGSQALADVSLTVAAGTLLVLLGPSGSGRTTLLRCVADIERVSGGAIRIGGRVVADGRVHLPPERRELAMVFQDYALWPHLSVRRNVGFSLARSGDTKEAQRRKVDDLLERVGIEALAERFPNELSGGEQQRVALARALAAEAGLILFDEPLSNLDADRREQLRVEIATLTRESGSTVIYITHDQSEAFALADRVGVLNRGELIQCATPEEIYRRPASPFVAKFTGVAGELAVQVRAEHEGVYEVVLAHGEARSFRAVAPQRGLRGAARVLVRAAGVRLVPVENEEGLAGVVVDVAFTGRGYEHVVKLGEDHMLRKVFASSRFDRDRAVRVVFEPATTLLFAEERGK